METNEEWDYRLSGENEYKSTARTRANKRKEIKRVK